MDGIIPAYVLHEFPVWVGLVVVMGLISAGLSTLEGLIQALATTLTAIWSAAGGRCCLRTSAADRALLVIEPRGDRGAGGGGGVAVLAAARRSPS